MSYSVDVNLLLYASNRSSPFHQNAVEFLSAVPTRPEILGLAWVTVMSYLRIATHPTIFAEPLNPDEARGNVESLMSLPQVRMIHEEDGFWTAYTGVTTDVPSRGNLVPDAHLATILLQNGINVLYTSDLDFRKFEFLEVRSLR